jgi:hypothetical protein
VDGFSTEDFISDRYWLKTVPDSRIKSVKILRAITCFPQLNLFNEKSYVCRKKYDKNSGDPEKRSPESD